MKIKFLLKMFYFVAMLYFIYKAAIDRYWEAQE